MRAEIQALKKNSTWHLVARTPNMNIIGSKWIYEIKNLNAMVPLDDLRQDLLPKATFKYRVLIVVRQIHL